MGETVVWSENLTAEERAIRDSFMPRGSYEVQRDALVEAFHKWPRLGWEAGSAAGTWFIMPLLQRGKLDIHGWVVEHPHERAGIGKSTAMEAVASIWGDPTVGRLIRSWNGTLNYLESQMAFLHDLPLFLEELQGTKSTARIDERSAAELTAFIHALALGRGRGRLNRDATMRITSEYNVIAFVAAERSILDYARTTEGVRDRVLTIKPPLGTEKTLEAARENDRLREIVHQHYGHMGDRTKPVIYDLVVRRPDEMVKRYDTMCAVLTTMARVGAEQAGRAARLAKRVAVGWLGLVAMLEACAVEDARDLARTCTLMAWRDIVEGIPAADNVRDQGLDIVREYVAAHQAQVAGFEPVASEGYHDRVTYRIPSEYVGGKAVVDGVECIAVFPEALARFLESRGMSLDTLRRAWNEAGMIVTDASGRTSRTVRLRRRDGESLGSPRCIVFRQADLLGDEHGE
ncbi:DUF927 domain-containing protein [Limnochorda pilosa]|uniref:DUF927 domain-containing protein n=1 Tax=Limnochorda pilosa TaxID=1555112 RepID=A0A0K2SQU7_LIMPI|nr:DUF927 domain-containing protein [Limnochorda pilosa]BAS29382.1 hypothetical protein LIP_3571 [Limnochorda pilosa]